jgi:hypothetical protein
MCTNAHDVKRYICKNAFNQHASESPRLPANRLAPIIPATDQSGPIRIDIMFKLILAAAALAIAAPAMAQSVYHQGYTTQGGTYVQPHYQSAPNSTTYDNWSTQGNVNPYTGQAGTRSPYGSTYGR